MPEPEAEAIANQPVVARSQNSITLLPISPTGAVVGVAYGYEMPHCGLHSPIDVDGSFWDPIDEPADSVSFDGDTGSFRLVLPNEAVFLSRDGHPLRLRRHPGPKTFGFCM